MLENVFKIISGIKTDRRKVACRIKRNCCPPSQPFCEETSWKWRLWKELDQYQKQCDLQNFKPMAKANKQNDLMGADFPLFRGPGQKWFCCDWSAHLFYRTRLSTWRFSGLFIPALPQACWNQRNYLAKSSWVETRCPGPGVWKGIPPHCSSGWKAESFWKTRWFESQQMPQGLIECGWLWTSSLCSPPEHTWRCCTSPAPLSLTPGMEAVSFIYSCLNFFSLAAAWCLLGHSFVCASSVSDPKSVCLRPPVGEAWCDLPSLQRFPSHRVPGISSLVWLVWVIQLFRIKALFKQKIVLRWLFETFDI